MSRYLIDSRHLHVTESNSVSEGKGRLLPEVIDLSGDGSHQLVADQLDEHGRRGSGNDDGLHRTQFFKAWTFNPDSKDKSSEKKFETKFFDFSRIKSIKSRVCFGS